MPPHSGGLEIKMITVILILIIILLAAALLIMRRRHIKMLDRLDHMLETAAENSFSESEFTESRLSKTETKMYRYLSAGKTSFAQINSEKETIKSLISDISHQTKTPISNILLYSELLCDSPELSESSKKLAGHIKAQTEKLNFLIGSLVKISRLENGIVLLAPKENSIAKLFSSLDFQNKAKSKGIDLRIESSIKMTAFFDFKWTAEAISNIIDNAIKYTPNGGRITVTAVPYEMFVKIDVEDNGIGIREEDYPKIFTRFYRSQRVSDEQGVGIGLYLAREIISRQGGYIKVVSEENKGSLFSVFIPKNANMSKV